MNKNRAHDGERTHQFSNSPPKYRHHIVTNADMRISPHPLIFFKKNTYAGCMAKFDDATFVVSLHLQHADAIVQLCCDWGRACHSPICTLRDVCTYCFGPDSKPLKKKEVTEASLRKKLRYKMNHSQLFPIAYESWAPTKATFPKLCEQSSAWPLHTVARRWLFWGASARPEGEAPTEPIITEAAAQKVRTVA